MAAAAAAAEAVSILDSIPSISREPQFSSHRMEPFSMLQDLAPQVILANKSSSSKASRIFSSSSWPDFSNSSLLHRRVMSLMPTPTGTTIKWHKSASLDNNNSSRSQPMEMGPIWTNNRRQSCSNSRWSSSSLVYWPQVKANNNNNSSSSTVIGHLSSDRLVSPMTSRAPS